jgi:hypothetical protein
MARTIAAPFANLKLIHHTTADKIVRLMDEPLELSGKFS